MDLTPRPQDTALPSPREILVAIFLAVAIYFGAGRLAGDSWGGDLAPFPYVWRDVALVHFLCALPLGWLLSNFMRRKLTVSRSVGLGGLVLVLSGLSFTASMRPILMELCRLNPIWGSVVRAVPALGLSFGTTLLNGIWLGVSEGSNGEERRKPVFATVGLGLAILLLVPLQYVSVRCRHDQERLETLLEQTRLGDARTLAYRLLVLDPQGKCQGMPISRMVQNLDQIGKDLESRVALPLPGNASTNQRLERARQMAMLGKDETALGILHTVSDSALVGEVQNLLGTIYEHQGAWGDALAAYQRARAEWNSQPHSSTQAAGLQRAIKGLSYCQRKLGNYGEAEASYQQLLDLAPTADTHFLLAQFYEDTEQTEKAQTHARHAMALAPDRYGQAGEVLINKLTVFHFGCWSVFGTK